MNEQDHPLLRKINRKLTWIIVLLAVLVALGLSSLVGLGVRVDFPPAETLKDAQ